MVCPHARAMNNPQHFVPHQWLVKGQGSNAPTEPWMRLLKPGSKWENFTLMLCYLGLSDNRASLAVQP